MRSANGTPGATPASVDQAPPSTLIRYGRMGFVGEFSVPPSMRLRCGTPVIVQTDRGIELGEQVQLTCQGCQWSIGRDRVRQYVEASGPEYLRYRAGRVLRVATRDDLAEARHLRSEEAEKMAICQRYIEARGLPMKLVEAEHLFGGERIIFYFMAEGRVDFRELVRDLAHEFQTRIEMRQVGARDEARLIADYETCGRECCCKNFLKTLKPVSMKMAKMQKATLDPSKVSGRCGRLKCCLRYEQETYEELDRNLPRAGTRVRSPEGEGVVSERHILAQLVAFQTDDGRRIVAPIEDVQVIGAPAPRTGAEPDAEDESDADLNPDVSDPPRAVPADGAPAGLPQRPTRPPGRRRGRRGQRRRNDGTSPGPRADQTPAAGSDDMDQER